MAYSTVCVAQRLPVELLCEIFDYLQEEYVNLRLWRDAAGSEARFWTWINVFVNDTLWTPAYLDEEIRWSRDIHGLRLTILTDPSLPDLPENVLRARMDLIMASLRESSCVERCVGVRINVASDTPMFGPLSRLIGVNDFLTRLNLSSEMVHQTLITGDPGIHCFVANLRALTIDGCNLLTAYRSQSLGELSLTEVTVFNYPPPLASLELVDEFAMFTQLFIHASSITIRSCEFSWPHTPPGHNRSQRRDRTLFLEDLSSATVLCIWETLDIRSLHELSIVHCGLPTFSSRRYSTIVDTILLRDISAEQDMATFLEDMDMYHLRVTNSPAFNNRVLEMLTNSPPGTHGSTLRCLSLSKMAIEGCNNWTIYALRSMVKRRNRFDNLGFGLWKVSMKDVTYRLTPYDISCSWWTASTFTVSSSDHQISPMPYTDDEEIHALLHYNPPSIKASPVTTDGDAPALSFYDKHLSPNLALKRVVHLPTLLQDMTKALDACMDIIEAQAITLPPVGCSERFRTIGMRKVVRVNEEATDALSIARLYETTTGENCQTVASTLVLTPHCSLWLPAVFFGRVDTDVEDNPTDQSFSLEEYSLCLPSSSEGLILHPQIKECLSASNLELLQHLFKRDRRLSTWEFLPYTSQAIDVIQNLCSGKSRKQTARRFEMRVPQSIKIKAGTFQSPDVAIPLDVEVTPWHPQDLTRNLRPRRTSSLTNPADCPSVKFCFASPRSKSLSTVVNDVLQHAWVTACRRDSTFIVFQCGNYERIGVRHRATQTLYLSDVIDVPNITDPGSYTELHLNLYVLILRDALQRAAYLRPKDDVPPLPRKRRREEGEVLAGTRQGRKLRSYGKHSVDKPVANSATSKSYDDIRSRNLLLVSLQYGVYSSPKPAAFFRPGHHPIVSESGRVVYTASEYIHIRLTSLITRGGTGTVHEGKLETYCKDGLVSRDIVAKLAFGSDQKQRMMHEATIYEHLTKSGVSCIPTCYGIFEEPHDDGPSVLVTSHEGYWLQHWNRGSTDIAVPKNWRHEGITPPETSNMPFRKASSLQTYTTDIKDEVVSQSAIKDLLARPSRPLQKAPNHTTSTGSRPPGMWDKHLNKDQILKHVGIFDELPQHLDKLVEDSIHKHGPFSPEAKIELTTLLTINVEMLAKVKNEAGIGSYYSLVVGPVCSFATSILLGAESSIVSWTLETSETQSKAVADGHGHLDRNAILASSSLSMDMKDDLLLVATTFPEFLVFEIKSLVFDTDAQFQLLLDIAAEEDYCWIRCIPGECKRSHFHQGLSQITCARMGPDRDADAEFPFPYPKYKKPDTRNRKRPHGEELDESCQLSRLLAYSPTELKARYIIQQAYAEAVARDTTFLVIRCGNRELIGLRNREDQTLHLSGIIDSAATTGPSYVRLHTGLYIASILDAIQRARRLERGMGLATWRDNWAQTRVKQDPPSPETLLALAREMPKIVLHEPRLDSPTKVANPPFLRMGTDPDAKASSDYVMQIKNAIRITERTYRAALQVMSGTMVVYLKLAISRECRSNLVKEHTAYQTLAGNSSIPAVIGCFEYTEPNFPALVLITCDAGMPIIPEDSEPTTTVSFTEALEAIHAAGYTHGSVDIDHFLTDGHKTTIVSVAKLADYDPGVADAEMESLRSMLIPKHRRLSA
ncbi:hypothetical protein EYR40_003364 [Pleurotus pulmonarius]|nr:hypothetical protein EYR40_003364 [Pleurotus pulmonarius]